MGTVVHVARAAQLLMRAAPSATTLSQAAQAETSHVAAVRPTRCQAARSSLPQTNQSSSQADLKSMHSDIALPGLHGRHKACSPRRLHHEPSAPSEHWWRILLETALLPRRGQLRGCLIKSWPCLPRPVAANEDLPWLKGRSDQWLGRCLYFYVFLKKSFSIQKSQGSSKPCRRQHRNAEACPGTGSPCPSPCSTRPSWGQTRRGT